MFDEIRDRYFPLELPGEIRVVPMPKDEFHAIRGTLVDQVFTGWNARPRYSMPQERRDKIQHLVDMFTSIHHEYFLFYHQQTPIGWSFGRMENAITYRMNNTGVLPQFQRQGIYSAFTRHMLAYLKELGYERVTSYHHLTNRAVLTAKLKLGFNIAGTMMSEDVGATVQLTYFFYPDTFQAFEDILGQLPDQTRAT